MRKTSNKVAQYALLTLFFLVLAIKPLFRRREQPAATEVAA